jgi:hypothetical protein
VAGRGESAIDNPHRSTLNPNFKDMEKCFFYVRADADIPNPIIRGYGVGYGIGEIQ